MSVRVAIALMLVGMTQAIPLEESAPEPTALPNTRIEAFLAASGSSAIKQVYPIGSIQGLSLEALVLSEPGKEPRKVKGLRAEITESGAAGHTHSSYVDVDELEGLLQAVDNMDRLLNQWSNQKSESRNEVMFVTRGNFKLGCYDRGGDQRIFASSGVIGRADFLGDPKELPRLREMLRLASDKLREP